MAVTRRAYIFSAFLLSVLNVLLILITISSNSWIVSTAFLPDTSQSAQPHVVRYGMFKGVLTVNILATEIINDLHMTCVPSYGACAVSCKTEATARQQEVEALAQGYRPSTACTAVTTVDQNNPMSPPPVISFALYVCNLLLLFLMLLCGVVAAALAIINATMNPTEPVFGLPGCLWANIASALLGLVVMLLFGIYWANSGLKDHLAFSYISLVPFVRMSPSLGYSYWLLLAAMACSIANVVLIQVRAYLLERNPPTPTIKVENHSDGTIFLY